jgi:ubiquinone/menaquinone biosynthesis C-methylase UbiE
MASFQFMARQRLKARLLAWLFERLYHELAWWYDLVAALVSNGYWADWIRAALPRLQGGRVLELGCGTGHLQAALYRASIPHAGLDLSRPMLAQALRRMRRSRLDQHLLRANARAIPFGSSSFTDVAATFPAPYILEPVTLAEIRRVLRPGGQLVIVDGGVLHSTGWYESAVDLIYGRASRTDAASRYQAKLEDAGFAVEVQQTRIGQSSVTIVIGRPRQHADTSV